MIHDIEDFIGHIEFEKRLSKNTSNSYKNDLNKYKDYLKEKGIINTFEMHHYTHIDTIYYKGRLGIQMILYSNKQTYPRRWFVEKERIEEIL